MYYRRQGEPQGIYGSDVSNTYQPYYKEDFDILNPSMTNMQRYTIWAIVIALFILLAWLLYKRYGHKISRKGSISMFY